MKTITRLGVLLICLLPGLAAAMPITFDLRDPAIEAIDGVPTFSLAESGLTATFTANVGVLNRTASSFGINIVDTSCGGQENSAQIDNGCSGPAPGIGLPPELVAIAFDVDVIIESITVSSFGSSDDALFSVFNGLAPPTQIAITQTGTTLFPANLLQLALNGQSTLEFIAGNGFSFDAITVSRAAVPLPGVLSLFGIGLIGVGISRCKARQTA